MENDRIHAAISSADMEVIIQSLGAVKSKLNFLISLTPQEKKALFKMGNAFKPFVQMAIQTAEQYPQIISPSIDVNELKKDYELYNNLTLIFTQLSEIFEGVDNSLTASGSDCLSSSLDIYGEVKANRAKIAGLNAVYEEMKPFFKRSKNITEAPVLNN